MAMRNAGDRDGDTSPLPDMDGCSAEEAAPSVEPAAPSDDAASSDDEEPLSAEEVLREALPFVAAMAKKQGFDEDGQREIAQEVGVVLVEKMGEYAPRRGRPRMWAAGIARRVMLDAQRRQRTELHRNAPAEALGSRPAPDLTPEERLRVRAALAVINDTLSEDCRAVCELVAEGFSAYEIGELLGMPESTVEFRLKQARKDVDRALARMGEDRESALRVRNMLVPFGIVGEVGRGTSASLLVHAGKVAHVSSRVVMSVGRFAATGAVIFASGAAAGIALYAALTEPEPDARLSIAADTAASVSTATTIATVDPTATATGKADPAATVNATVRTAAVFTTAAPATSLDPATTSESMLLQMALAAPPARALQLASLHAQRFPSHNTGKRELITVRALVALGRRSEAEVHARALRGTVYEKAVQDALGSPKE